MFKLFDFKCPKCNCKEEYLVGLDEIPECATCVVPMEVQATMPKLNTRGCSDASDKMGHTH